MENKFVRSASFQGHGTSQVSSLDDLKNDFFFPVEQRSVKDLFPEYSFPQSLTHGIIMPETNKILNLCSEDYEVVTNRDLVEPAYKTLIRLYGKKNIEIEAVQVDDRKFYFKLNVTSKKLNVQKGDLVNPSIIIENSYDGSLSHCFRVGFYRLLCSNGLMAVEEETTFKKKHKSQSKRSKEEYGSSKTDYYIQRSIEQLEEKLVTIDERLGRLQRLTERRLSPKEVRELITAISPEEGKKDKIKFPKKLLVEVPLKLQEETERLDVEPSKWLLYNAFNFQLNHAKTALPQEEKARIDREIFQLIEVWG